EKFSAAFESVPVAGETEIRYGARTESVSFPRGTAQAEVKLPWQTGALPLSVAPRGTGRPWAIVRATAALPLDAPLSTGYRITRTATPVRRKGAARGRGGDPGRA